MTEREPDRRDEAASGRRHIWDDPRNVDRLFRVFFACCALLVALDFVVHRHEVHPLERLVAFYPLYGFVGITVLVLLARLLRRLMMRPEDYYDGE